MFNKSTYIISTVTISIGLNSILKSEKKKEVILLHYLTKTHSILSLALEHNNKRRETRPLFMQASGVQPTTFWDTEKLLGYLRIVSCPIQLSKWSHTLYMQVSMNSYNFICIN